MSCFLCGKKDHYFWECKFLKNKKDENENANEAIVIKDIIAMVSDVYNKDHYISYGCNYKSFQLVFWFMCNVACVQLQGTIQDLWGVFHRTIGGCGHPQFMESVLLKWNWILTRSSLYQCYVFKYLISREANLLPARHSRKRQPGMTLQLPTYASHMALLRVSFSRNPLILHFSLSLH